MGAKALKLFQLKFIPAFFAAGGIAFFLASEMLQSFAFRTPQIKI